MDENNFQPQGPQGPQAPQGPTGYEQNSQDPYAQGYNQPGADPYGQNYNQTSDPYAQGYGQTADPYAGQYQEPQAPQGPTGYEQQPQDPYGQSYGQTADPYGQNYGQTADPYGQSYGQTPDPYAGQYQEPQAPQGPTGYEQQAQDPYAQGYNQPVQTPYTQQPQGPQGPQTPTGPAMQYGQEAQSSLQYTQPEQPSNNIPNQPGNTPNTAAQPKKKGKGGIIALILGLVAGFFILGCVGVFALFKFATRETGGAKAPEDIAKAYIECYNDGNAEGMRKYISRQNTNTDEVISSLDAQISLDKTYDFEYDEASFSSTVSSSYSKSDRNDKLDEMSYSHKKVKDMVDVDFSADFTSNVYDYDVTGNQQIKFTCIKIGKKWFYLSSEVVSTDYDVAGIDLPSDDSDDDILDDDTDDDTIDDATDDDADADTDSSSTPTSPSVTTSVDGLSSDLFSQQVAVDGKVYTLPFAYSEISDVFTFDAEGIEFTDGSNTLDPGYSTSVVPLDYKNSTTSSWLNIYGSFQNDNSEASTLDKCTFTGIDVDINYVDDTNYPQLVLPGGITWGSNKADIEAAYGKPDSDNIYESDSGYTSYTYKTDDYSYQVRLYIYDDKGLQEIDIDMY